ncbi:abortive infection system antitoxin AbiGi family protein [Dyadobacter sp. CY343]|uniref:abortive infection system antitoxin AbiGi family protein n=1 Tax=Dyadobacter sp. CY343 TaxID=2907299 RepID=UPI001F2FB6BA|nr:abortive infection system antitoxin AbiGi family protein [Dyadobacter sp. CY343]MCE7059210.1 abortive infection system antitoxin AbiGi family protein [Dyadobacter sp. CY343]
MPALKGILSEGFRVKYNRELHPKEMAGGTNLPYESVITPTFGEVSSNTYPRVDYLWIPMVSFCDIPLSSIRDHLETYGFEYKYENFGREKSKKIGYAIGLTKEWGKRNDMNPLLYLVFGSNLARRIFSAFIQTKEKQTNEDEVPKGGGMTNRYYVRHTYFPPVKMGEDYVIRDNLGNQFPIDYLYVKPVAHKSIPHPDYVIENNFQDEKEWRFVPGNAHIISSYVWRTASNYSDFYRSSWTNAERAMQEAPPYENVQFQYSDITHIIVGHESEIPEIQQHLKTVYQDIPESELMLLYSKVTSYERLVKDM